MSKYKSLFLILFGLTLYAGCKKIPEGFLSESIRYEEEPIIIQKGRTKVSTALNLDGSNKPVTIKLLHFYNKTTGAIVDDLFLKKYTIKGWKSQYDNKTDTTLELIAAKQFDMEVSPITINPASGQVEANFTTLYLPAGDYVFDLEISNSAGSKQYPKIGSIQLVDAKPYEAHPEIGTPYNRMIKVGNESQGTSLFNPIVIINRVADSPNVVVLKFIDKNGVPFNPKMGEIARRPYPGNNPPQPFLQTLQDYSLKTTLFDDRMEFSYGVVPFPLVSLGNGFNIYYRIPTQYFKHDNLVAFPDGQFSANPRFVFHAFSPGKYVITYKFTDITHK